MFDGKWRDLHTLGNLTRFEGNENHLSITVQNSCMHLLISLDISKYVS